jgi:hypothetical protein
MKVRILALVAAAAALSGAAQAQLLNGNFESGDLTGWSTAGPGNVVVVDDTLMSGALSGYVSATPPGFYVDLTGTEPIAGGGRGVFGNSISQTFNFTPGAATLSFALGATGWHDAAVDVVINGTTFSAVPEVDGGSPTQIFDNTWATRTIDFTALASNTITFTGRAAVDGLAAMSIGLDNITVTSAIVGPGPGPGPIVTPIPEPSAYALALVGLGALGVMSRRRKRQG